MGAVEDDATATARRGRRRRWAPRKTSNGKPHSPHPLQVRNWPITQTTGVVVEAHLPFGPPNQPGRTLRQSRTTKWVGLGSSPAGGVAPGLDLPPGGSSSPPRMARAEKRRAASTAAAAKTEEETPARSADHRRALYFAAFLVLADAALVALIVAFVPCL